MNKFRQKVQFYGEQSDSGGAKEPRLMEGTKIRQNLILIDTFSQKT